MPDFEELLQRAMAADHISSFSVYTAWLIAIVQFHDSYIESWEINILYS